MDTRNYKKINDAELRDRNQTFFIEATSDNPSNERPTLLVNIGNSGISHVAITSRYGEQPTRCHVYFRDRDKDASGGDNYYLEGLRADTFLEGLRQSGSWPLAAEVTMTAGGRSSTGM